MADIRQVEVIFKNEITNGGEPATPSEKVKEKKQKKVKTTENGIFDEALKIQTLNTAKEDVIRIANYEMNKWFTLKDDYIGQRNITNTIAVISRAKSTATAIAGGFTMFGAVGAMVSAVGSAISLAIDIAQNYDQQNIKIRQMDAQLSFQRQRAGYSLTSGRIGENK